MRIGLAGVGRIGRFHASTLTGLPQVDTVVLTDVVPGLPRAWRRSSVLRRPTRSATC